MKGPEAKRARPLAERFADLETRIQGLEAKARSVTPGEHTVADLINDLRNRCDIVRSHLETGSATGPEASPEAHVAARGTAATWASAKDTDTPPGTPEGRPHGSPSQPAEAAFRDLEDAYERALIRFS